MKRDDTPVLLGGLNTRLPPTLLNRQESPDLQNVLVRDGTVMKRGGFTPMFRDRMPGDCVETRATHSYGANTASADVDFVNQPGHLIAGHREVYEAQTAMTGALWFSPNEIPATNGGDGQTSGSPYSGSPYTVRVIPILSKGPVKRSDQTTTVTAANEWGTASQSGMPFCLYLYNSGVNTWTLRLAAHVLVAGSWTLKTVTSSLPIQVGERYHCIFAVSGTRVAIRVARVREGYDPSYVEDTTSFSGTLAFNKCPIQVMDCPQLFVTATNVGSGTQRPGLNLGGSADGGYWNCVVRFPGKIDDISIWSGDLTLSTLETRQKRQFTGQPNLINLWSFDGGSIDYIPEKTGRGNHLFFAPRGPVSINDDGGKEGGSWFFNGETSWALLDVDTPNWRAQLLPAPLFPYDTTKYLTATTGTPLQLQWTAPMLTIAASQLVGMSAFYSYLAIAVGPRGAIAASATTITDAAGTLVPSAWVGYKVRVLLGAQTHTTGTITANGAAIITVSGWSNGTPTTPCTYEICSTSNVRGRIASNTTTTLTVESWTGADPNSVANDGGDLTIYWDEPGMMWSLVRHNMAHGIGAEFWLDSIEPRWPQTIAEVHSVMRLDVDTNGKLSVYVRDGSNIASGAMATATDVGKTYQGPYTSTTVLRPGRRYQVAAVRRAYPSLFVDIYIDGVIDASVAISRPSTHQGVATNGISNPPGGMTVGFGCVDPMIGAPSPDWSAMASPMQVNTDPTTGFCGRIEAVRLLCGSDAATRVKRHGREREVDWKRAGPVNYKNPVTYRHVAQSSDTGDALGSVSGYGLQLTTQVRDGWPILNATNVTSGNADLKADTTGQDLASNPPVDGWQTAAAVTGDLYFVFGYWRFSVDDLDAASQGLHSNWEYRYLTGGVTTATQVVHPWKRTHLQESEVADACGFFGSALRCCTEQDIQTDTAAVIAGSPSHYTARQRPYGSTSPKEIGPRWTTALARSPIGTTPVTMLATFDTETESRRLFVAACARSLFWAKPQWDGGYLWFAGGQGSHVYATSAAGDLCIVGTGTKSVLQIAMWVKPTKLDGQRMLACSRTISSTASDEQAINWMLYVDNGSLAVLGTEGAAAVWRYEEGSLGSGTTDVVRSTSLKVGVWNHVCLQLQASGPVAWVNGQQIPMQSTSALTGANQTNAWGTSASSASTGTQFWIGGSPDDAGRVAVPSSTSAIVIQTESWHGYIADVQVRRTLDTARYSGASAFPPPRLTADSNATYWWKLTEGDGWLLANSGTASSFSAEARIKEFIAIVSGLRQQSGSYYSFLTYRNELFVTNGADYPTKIQWNGISAPDLWTARRVGIQPPTSIGCTSSTLTGSATSCPAGIYQVYVSFVSDQDIESEPALLLSYTAAAPIVGLGFNLRNVPRSSDPQVTKRRIYASPVGGGTPVFHRDVLDNSCSEIDVVIYGAIGASLNPGTRWPAPRGRRLGIAGGALVIADLTDGDSGRNSIAFSSTGDPELFTATGLAVVLPSEEGKPIVGSAHNLGQMFFCKRDAIYVLGVGSIVDATQVDAAIRLINASDGFGGGTAAANGLLYGCGDRGVFQFDNTNPTYLSDAIERTWRLEVDRTNDGIYAMHGAFWRGFSQYWLSVQLRGETSKQTIFVFDFLAQKWVRLAVPKHSFLTMVDPSLGKPVPAIGTLDGRVLAYNDDLVIDTVDNYAAPEGAITLSASAGLSGTATRMTVSGAVFPTGLAGLQGAQVTVVYNGGTVTRFVAANGSNWVEWSEDMPAGFSSYTSFSIGAISAYWSTPWFSDSNMVSPQKLTDVSLTFLPASGNLQVDITSAVKDQQVTRGFPTTDMETQLVPMQLGYSARPVIPRIRAQGQYHRLRIGTYGALDRFSLIGWSPTTEASVARAQVGRPS